MREQDPFADAEFTERAAKLLGMLSTAHAAEADTARRKLLEHLKLRGLSMTDLARRLHQPGTGGPASGRGESDPRLRQLQEENRRLLRLAGTAQRRVQALEASRKGALRRAMMSGGVAGAGTAGVLAMLVTLATWHAAPLRSQAPAAPVVNRADQAESSVVARAGRVYAASPQMAPEPEPSAHPGHVVTQHAVLLTAPLATAPPEAHLLRGTPVMALRRLETGGHVWLLVQTAVGNGYLAAEAVGP